MDAPCRAFTAKNRMLAGRPRINVGRRGHRRAAVLVPPLHTGRSFCRSFSLSLASSSSSNAIITSSSRSSSTAAVRRVPCVQSAAADAATSARCARNPQSCAARRLVWPLTASPGSSCRSTRWPLSVSASAATSSASGWCCSPRAKRSWRRYEPSRWSMPSTLH